MSGEVWRPVVGFEGLYEVSDAGRVRSLDRSYVQRAATGTAHVHRRRGQMLKPGGCASGHLSVALGRKGGSRMVHRLVLEAFVGPRPAKHEARHKNGRPDDNRLINLEWATRGRNIQDKKWHKKGRNQKLTGAKASELKAQLGAKTDLELAAIFGVSHYTVRAIRYGRFHCDA